MNKFALTVENLTKIYSNSKNKKQNKALNELNFNVKQGEVFGLLGPNGAGKTLLLKCMHGLINFDTPRIFYAENTLDKRMFLHLMKDL